MDAIKLYFTGDSWCPITPCCVQERELSLISLISGNSRESWCIYKTVSVGVPKRWTLEFMSPIGKHRGGPINMQHRIDTRLEYFSDWGPGDENNRVWNVQLKSCLEGEFSGRLRKNTYVSRFEKKNAKQNGERTNSRCNWNRGDYEAKKHGYPSCSISRPTAQASVVHLGNLIWLFSWRAMAQIRVLWKWVKWQSNCSDLNLIEHPFFLKVDV